MDNSSQPYLYYSDNNDISMLYCYGQSIKTIIFGSPYSLMGWKIYHKNLNDANGVVVNTPQYHPEYGEVILECNPHPIVINNEIYLYYTAGFYKGPNEPIRYKLCSIGSQDITFKDLDHDSWSIILNAFSATYYQEQIIFCRKEQDKSVLYSKNLSSNNITEIIIKELNLQFIYKINKIFNQDLFIITTDNKSILVDNNMSYIKNITNSKNDNLYKCSILDNVLAYTIKHYDTGSQESRSIVIENMDY